MMGAMAGVLQCYFCLTPVLHRIAQSPAFELGGRWLLMADRDARESGVIAEVRLGQI
jgi:hypothetical protein